MDATDFIPTKAKIEAIPVFDDVENFATDKELTKKTLKTIDDYDSRFTSQREKWAGNDTEEGIWEQCDWAFRSCINDAITQTQKKHGANEPSRWERAKIGTTQFYRQVTQMASNIYSVVTSKEMPFKYEPLSDNAVDAESDTVKERAKKMNLLAKWSMKKDGFAKKTIEFANQVKKYGNIPVMVEWKRKTNRVLVQKPIYGSEDPTEITSYEMIERDVIVDNRPVITILPIDAVKLDCLIGNIQDQDCVIVSSIVGMSDIISGVKDGYYREDIIKELSKSHQWDGDSGFDMLDSKSDNRLFSEEVVAGGSGRYLKREVFVNLPLDDKGKWDELKNAPRRYRVTTFGNDNYGSLVARIERNTEPDDTIPIEMIHANPDDPDMIYHISNYEVIRTNLSAEMTLIRQVVDNNSLTNKQPLWEVRGEVKDNNREFGPDARFIVESPNSIGQFQIRDVTQSTLGVLDYLKEDSNTANSIDKNMIGESFGARTSATEAATISSNSRSPNLVMIEYILEQYLGFIARRYKIGWENYGLRGQVVQITDEEDKTVFIEPTDISGEFDIVIDIVDDIKEDITAAQRMINYAQVVAQSPMAETVDWVEFNKVLAEKMMGTSKFVVQPSDGDVSEIAARNISLMLLAGQYPQMSDSMNLKKHLSAYKAERARWTGYEEQNPNIAILDNVIEQIEQRIAAPQQQQQAPQQAPATLGAAQGQPIQEALGGLNV